VSSPLLLFFEIVLAILLAFLHGSFRINLSILMKKVAGTEAGTQGLYLESCHQPNFCEQFFEIGSRELFVGAGFES
jgi:hypothetical protein